MRWAINNYMDTLFMSQRVTGICHLEIKTSLNYITYIINKHCHQLIIVK